MDELVRRDPFVGDAIRAVKLDISEELCNESSQLADVIDSLGSYHGLELRLLRVRDKMIGPMPRNRDSFDAVEFLNQIYKDNHRIFVLDSHDIDGDWKSILNKRNHNTKYNWDKLSNDMLAEEHDFEYDKEDNIDKEDDINNLPKRVLAFTSIKLLKLFSKCSRGSLDGTFKSSCKLWKQQFVWMLKFNKRWIPVVWGWLPDKEEASYKVSLTHNIKLFSLCGFSVGSLFVTFFLSLLQYNIWPLHPNCNVCDSEFAPRVNLRRHDTLTRTVLYVMTIFC